MTAMQGRSVLQFGCVFVDSKRCFGGKAKYRRRARYCTHECLGVSAYDGASNLDSSIWLTR
jgi:hypothetical protein